MWNKLAGPNPSKRRELLKKIGITAPLLAFSAKAAETSPDKAMADRLAIREVIENWVLYRDAGDWERFRTVWHDDGYMMATWFEGPATEFAKVSSEGMDHGVNIMHFLGGTTIDLAGNRAVSQTKMTISQRAPVHGEVCDVVCTGRFWDFFEKRNGKWAIVLRRLTYEKDRMDTVDPSKRITLDKTLLESFPIGYRHLGYLQSVNGNKVRKNMPGLRGPGTDALRGYAKDWLAGKPIGAARS